MKFCTAGNILRVLKKSAGNIWFCVSTVEFESAIMEFPFNGF